MRVNHITVFFLPLFLFLNLAAAVQRAPFGIEYYGEGSLQERQLFRNSTKLLFGLFRSRGIIGLLDQIPCEIIDLLENDQDEANRFFTEIESGQVPTLIENLPAEIRDRIVGLLDIALTIPRTIFEGAGAIINDTVELFNAIEDGSIVDRLEEVPGLIVSQITAGWGDFTSGFADIVDGFTCAFVDCPSTEPAGVCLSTTPASGGGESSTATGTDGISPTFIPTLSPSPRPSPSLTPSPPPTSTYIPSPTAEIIATANPTLSPTSATPPSSQGSEQFVGAAASMQLLTFKATEASLLAALVGIIGLVMLR